MKVKNKNDKKTYFLEVAKKVFLDLGYKKTSLSDIGHAAKRAKSGIYYYFHSKEEIFETIIDQEAKKIIQEINEKLADIHDPVEKIKVYFKLRLKHLKDATYYYAFLKKDVLEHLPYIEKIREKYEEIEKEILRKIFQEGIKKNIFKPFDVEKVVEALAKLIRGIEIPHFIEELMFSMENEMMLLIDIFVKGISKQYE